MMRRLLATAWVAMALAGCNLSAPANESLGGLAVGTAAAPAAEAGPRAWLDRPLDGSRYELGRAIPIRWHAADLSGVRQVEIRINGEPFLISEDLDHTAQLANQEAEWNPTEAGDYLIEVLSTGVDGTVGVAARKHVIILAEGGIVQGAVYADLNQDGDADDDGEGPLEGVSVVLAECTEKLSLITAADGAFRFEGLPFGTDCVIDLSRTGWRTTATYPPGIDLPIHFTPRLDPTSFSVFLSPIATPTPTRTPTPTVTLTPLPTRTPTPLPPDHQAPPAPQIVSPDGAVLGCLTSIVLRWKATNDPSGIDVYEVVLKVDTGGANFVVVSTWQLDSAASLDVSDQTDCGGTYGWMVRARDNAGNWSGYDMALFGIDLP